MSMKKAVRAKKKTFQKTKAARDAVQARAVAAKLIEKPMLSVGDAIREVGLSEFQAQHPSTITRSPVFADLLDEFLPQGELLETHRGLLKAAHIDHMVFADGPKDASSALEWIDKLNANTKGEIYTLEDTLTDENIRDMLSEKNCEVRRIARTENSRHVYFWSPDSRARKDALDMAYKLRGSYAADKAAVAFSLAALSKLRDQPSLDAPGASLPPGKTPLIGAIGEE